MIAAKEYDGKVEEEKEGREKYKKGKLNCEGISGVSP